jgi:transposase
MQRHRHQEFIRFLNAIEGEVPAGKMIHVILDNYAAHRHPKVRAWLDRHQRFVFHFTPTSASWLNAVEGFFAKLTRRPLKRGVFRSVVDLQAAINRFVAETNADPKPFTWTADQRRSLPPLGAGTKRQNPSTSGETNIVGLRDGSCVHSHELSEVWATVLKRLEAQCRPSRPNLFVTH